MSNTKSVSGVRKLTSSEVGARRDEQAKSAARDVLFAARQNARQSASQEERLLALVENLLGRIERLEKQVAAK